MMAFGILGRHASSHINWAVLGALFVAASTLGGPVWARADGGMVRVFYPDSLVHVMQDGIVQAFEQASDYRVAGHHARAVELASDIREQPEAVDVFVSASPRLNLPLMGAVQGDRIDWYAAFMASPLVLAYNPESEFAGELVSRPWYRVAAEPGFRLGLTAPRRNPRGRLAATALDRVVNRHRQNNLEKKLAANSRIVPPHDLIPRLQSRQLDAAFMYQSEAAAAGIPSVALDLGNIGAIYTVTILNDASHPGAASAFVAFLLGDKGQQILKEGGGLKLMRYTPVFGNMLAVPKALRPLVDTR